MIDWIQQYHDEKRKEVDKKGGEGSGHYGHAGRPGMVGGSQPGGLYLALDKHARRNARLGIMDCQKHGLDTGNERVISLGDTGSKIGIIDGTKDTCLLPHDILDQTVIQVHNHPSSSSFSPEDIGILMTEPTIKHSMVIGHDGTLYRISKTAKTPAMPEDWAEGYPPIKKLYESEVQKNFYEYQARVRAGKIAGAVMWKQHTHEVSIEVSKALNLDYRRVVP